MCTTVRFEIDGNRIFQKFSEVKEKSNAPESIDRYLSIYIDLSIRRCIEILVEIVNFQHFPKVPEISIPYIDISLSIYIDVSILRSIDVSIYASAFQYID